MKDQIEIFGLFLWNTWPSSYSKVYVSSRKKGNKMKKLVKLIMVLVLVMVSGCTTQKKEENARVIDTSIFLYKVSNQKGEYSYLFGTCHPGRYPIKSLDKVTEKALDESDSIYLECDMNPSPQKTE